MITLGLDISSKSTGHAVFKDGKLIRDSLGVIALNHKTHGERLGVFEKQLRSLIKTYKPDQVLIEDIWKGPNPRTLQILAYYHGVARKVVFQTKKAEPTILGSTSVRRVLEKKYDIVLVPSKKIKRARRIKKSSKELTFDFIKKRFKLRGYTFAKHNDITDAITLCLAFHLMGDDK